MKVFMFSDMYEKPERCRKMQKIKGEDLFSGEETDIAEKIDELFRPVLYSYDFEYFKELVTGILTAIENIVPGDKMKEIYNEEILYLCTVKRMIRWIKSKCKLAEEYISPKAVSDYYILQAAEDFIYKEYGNPFLSVAELLKQKYELGNFIFSYYKSEREFQVEKYKNIEKIELRDKYDITENPGAKLTKYLVDLKATQAFTKNKDKFEKIEQWFRTFENVLKVIFEDEKLQLKFNEETFQFSICVSGREPFDFNTMSSGYAAILDIINDLIIWKQNQKKILPILINLFPNIQFIVTTHSPFILSSVNNVVIYDLENKTLVENGMKNLPYEGIVEGYFKADRLSEELRKNFSRYKVLVSKLAELSDG